MFRVFFLTNFTGKNVKKNYKIIFKIYIYFSQLRAKNCIGKQIIKIEQYIYNFCLYSLIGKFVR